MSQGTFQDTPKKAPNQRKKASRKKRWLLGLLIFFLLTPFLLALATYWLLRSPLLHSHIWPRVEPILAEKTGFQVDLASLKIDLLGHLHIRGLQVQTLEPQASFCEDFNLTLEDFDLQFSPGALWRNELHIQQLTLSQLAVDGCLLVDLPPTETASAKPSTPPEDVLAELIQQLESPPMAAIYLDQLVLEDIQADLQIQLPAQALEVSWQGQLNLTSQLHWTARALSGQLQSQLTSYAPLQLNQQQPSELNLSLLPQLEVNLGWELTPSQGGSIQLNPLTAQVEVENLVLEFSSGDLQISSHWPEYRLSLEETGPTHLSLDANWPLHSEMQLLSHLPAGLLRVHSPDFYLYTTLQQTLDFTSQGHLNLLDPSLEHLQLEVNTEQILQALELEMEEQALSLDKLFVSLTAGSHGQKVNSQQAGDYLIAAQMDLLGLEAAPQQERLDLTTQLNLLLKQDLSQAKLLGKLLLDDWQLLDLEAQLINRPYNLELRPQVHVALPQELHHYRPELEVLQDLGALALQLDGQSLWTHGQSNLLQADLSALPWGEVTQDYQLELSQSAPPGDLQLTQPLKSRIQLTSDLAAQQHQLKLDLNGEVLHPPLLQPLPFAGQVVLQTDEKLEALSTQGQLNLNQDEFLVWELDLHNQPQQAKLASHLVLQVQPEWQAFLDDLAPLDELGTLQLEQDLKLTLAHPYASLLDLDPEAWPHFQLSSQFGHQLSQTAPTSTTLMQLPSPLELAGQLDWSAQEAEAELALIIPNFLFGEEIEGNGIKLALEAHSSSGLALDQLHLQLEVSQDQLILPEQLALAGWAAQLDARVDKEPEALSMQLSLDSQATDVTVKLAEEEAFNLSSLLFPLTLESKARLDLSEEQLAVEHFFFTLGDAWLTTQLDASSDFAGQRLLAEGFTAIQLQEGLFTPVHPSLQGQGQLHLPWSISWVGPEQLSVQAEADFIDFSLILPDAAIHQLQGQLKIQQELQLIDFERLRFAHLLQPDAFQRVDFNRVEPWLEGRQDFSIDQLIVDGYSVGPLEAALNLQQNLLRLQDFSLTALGGELAGNFYLDVNPAGWRLGLLSRVSRVDLRQLLPETLAETRYSPVNARTAIEFDFAQRLLEGRLDITDINRTQLLQILDIIDPDHRDTQIARARSALRAAHPRWVRAEMQNGLLDLTLSLSLFSEPIRVRNLPLSPLIERFAEEALLLPERLPLESTP